MRWRALVVRWLPAILVMGIIFGMSSIPSDEMPHFDWADLIVKKGGHMLGYALLAAGYRRGLGTKHGPAAWGLAVLYAASDEFHQSFVSGRNATLVDVGIDAVGAAIGLVILAWWQRKRLRREDRLSGI